MLEITRLQMRHSPTFMLDVPALVIQPGTIVCVTGPNGSGKTTLIDCLAGLVQPGRGVVRINGLSITSQRRRAAALLGLAPDDEQWFIKELTAQEYLHLLAQTYRKAGSCVDIPANIEQLAQRLGFTAFGQQLEQLSHGNKKKVQLIAALAHQPPVLVIDELRNGLDPLAILAAEELVAEAAAQGAAIVAATHDLWWAERIADEILLLIDGTIAHHQPTARIVSTYGSVEQLFRRTVNG